jgi:hypothetical protein
MEREWGSLDEKEGWISGWKERSSVDEKKTEAVDEKDGTMPGVVGGGLAHLLCILSCTSLLVCFCTLSVFFRTIAHFALALLLCTPSLARSWVSQKRL